jgi:hypothetical protein
MILDREMTARALNREHVRDVAAELVLLCSECGLWLPLHTVSSRVCVCVCVCVCVHICLYVCMHVFMYVCTYVHGVCAVGAAAYCV